MSTGTETRRSTVGAWIFAGALLLLAAGLLAGGCGVRSVMGRAKNWDSTNGTVTRSGTKPQAGKRFPDGSYIETRHAADVPYRYTVGKKTYDEHQTQCATNAASGNCTA